MRRSTRQQCTHVRTWALSLIMTRPHSVPMTFSGLVLLTSIGEYVARAGARKITLVDKTSVKPGILVRQQYHAQHVGFTKQSAMRVNLLAIVPECDVVQLWCDLRRGLPDDLDLGETDLIIDATASRHVAAAMQLELESKNDCPPLLACCVDSTALRGLATIRMPQSTAGPSDINRIAKLSAFTRNGLGGCVLAGRAIYHFLSAGAGLLGPDIRWFGSRCRFFFVVIL